METTLKTDVLIVGAGPTGLMMAAQLIRYGIDFIIVDKKEGPTDLSKALVIHARTLEIFDQFGLADKAVDQGERVQQLALLHGGNVSARIPFYDIGKGLSPFPFVLVHEQSKTEHLLYDYLRQQGKDVRWQTAVETLNQDETGVTVVTIPSTGERQTIQARYVVGADGAGSPVRHLLNLGFAGSTYPRLFYVADVDADYQTEANTMHIAFREKSFMLVVPMEGENHWRFIGNIPEYDAQADPEISYDQIEAKVTYLLQRPLNVTKVRWYSTYKVHTRHAEKFGLGRCFLAGDAAHVHTPAGGQGMNTGIQDAYNLAWKLAFVLNGRAGADLLNTYNEERLANAKHLLQTTDRLFDVAAGQAWGLQFFRDHLLPGVASVVSHIDRIRALLFPTVSMLNVNYRDQSLSRSANGADFEVKAGDRLPYFRVGESDIYDQLRAPRFHLLLFSDGEQAYETLRQAVTDTYGGWMDCIVVPLYPHVTALFGPKEPFMVLVRPDNYIGFLSADVALNQIQAYLTAILGRVLV